MTQSVTLVRDAAEAGGRDVFSCTPREWALLCEFAEVFGWQPRGTTYIRTVGAKPEDAARHSYEAGANLDPKRVDSDDARSWAAALDRARRSPHFEALIDKSAADASLDASHAHFAAVLDDFVEYAYGGEFFFASATHTEFHSRR